MRYLILPLMLCSLYSFGQTERLKLTDKDTLITCGLIDRSEVSGPFEDAQASDFEKLVEAVFAASKFPAQPYTLYQMKRPGYLRLGRHKYDELEFRTFLLYNLDSVLEFNIKSRSRYGLMSILAHEAGHHSFNHFLKSPTQSTLIQELQADYYAGWILSTLNVPREEIGKGISLVADHHKASPAYPSKKDRIKALYLGYDLGKNDPEEGPLNVLANRKELDKEWLKKWSRKITVPGEFVVLTDGIFGDTHERFVMDKEGQVIFREGGENYVVARAIPSKDRNYKFILFDNHFNVWLIDREGTIKDKSGAKAFGRVNLRILNNEPESETE